MAKEGPREVSGVNKLLIGFVVVLLGSLWGVAWADIKSNESRVNEVEKVVPVLETQYKNILRRLDSIEDLLKPRR